MAVNPEEKIQNAINKYPISLDAAVSIVEDLERLAGKLSPSGAVSWLKDIVNREVGESCDWCQGGAGDLVYGSVHGDINRETGIMTIWSCDKEVGSRKVNYCPMCGRRVGSREMEVN